MDAIDSTPWLAIGMVGNGLFMSRFLIQWVASERAGRSLVPRSFWYLSLAGSVILLAYAVHRRDPVFVLGYLPNTLVYLRNLELLERERAAGPAPAVSRKHSAP